MDDTALKRLADPEQYRVEELRGLSRNDGELREVARYLTTHKDEIDRDHPGFRRRVFRDVVELAKDRAREAYAQSVELLLNPETYTQESLRDTLRGSGYSGSQGITDYVREHPVPHQKRLLDDINQLAFTENSELAKWLKDHNRFVEWNEYRDAQRSLAAAYRTRPAAVQQSHPPAETLETLAPPALEEVPLGDVPTGLSETGDSKIDSLSPPHPYRERDR